MFEGKTSDKLLELMLIRAKEINPEVSLLEGGLVHTCLSAFSVLMEDAYDSLEELYCDLLPDLCSEEMLDRYAERRGIVRGEGKKAVCKIGTMLSIGDNLTLGEHIFTVTQVGADYSVCTADSAGECLPLAVGATLEGDSDYTVTEVSCYGEGAQSIASYRQDVIDSFTQKISAGNRDYYIKLAEEFQGVGKCIAVYMVTVDGNAKVGVYCLKDNATALSSAEKEALRVYLQDNANLGHSIYVGDLSGVTCNFACTLTVKTGYNLASVKADIENKISEYIRCFNMTLGEEDKVYTLRKSFIESTILTTTEGIEDFAIAGSNISLVNKNAYAVMGAVTWS